MGFQAVLDADVLLPAPLRDTLLRLAEAELYVPGWSERILAEVTKNLVASGRTDAERAARVTETSKTFHRPPASHLASRSSVQTTSSSISITSIHLQHFAPCQIRPQLSPGRR